MADIFFLRCIEVVSELQRSPPFSQDETLKWIISEAVSRTEQLGELMKLTLTHEELALKATRDDDLASFHEPALKALLFAECFYMLAFRVYDISKCVNKRLFHEEHIAGKPIGVRDVRNHLIVHPEKRKKPVLTRGFRILPDVGVCLKSIRYPHEGTDIVDNGFRTNAQEFFDFLRGWLEEVLRRVNARAPAP